MGIMSTNKNIYKVTNNGEGKYTVEKVTDDSATAPVETQDQGENVEGQGENVEGQGENVEGQGEKTDDSATTETNVGDQNGDNAQGAEQKQEGGKRRRRKRRSRKS